MARLWFPLVLLSLPFYADAAYLYDWDSGSNVVLSIDPVGDAPPAQDILGLWWGRDDTSMYLRMDLAAPPVASTEICYGIYADVMPGYGSPPNYYRVPDQLSDVDYYISAFFDGTGVVGWAHQWHPAGLFMETQLPPGYVQATENGGRTIEWLVPYAYPGGVYPYWGAVVQANFQDTLTMDITSQMFTPEPSTLALLALGAGGLYLKRRRSRSG